MQTSGSELTVGTDLFSACMHLTAKGALCPVALRAIAAAGHLRCSASARASFYNSEIIGNGSQVYTAAASNPRQIETCTVSCAVQVGLALGIT